MTPKVITALQVWTESHDPLAESAITIASLCVERGCEPDQLSRLMCFCFAAGRLSLTVETAAEEAREQLSVYHFTGAPN